MSKPKRVRSKPCHFCDDEPDELFRIQCAASEGAWVFTCAGCRRHEEAAAPGAYQYGGTWKSKKRH